jgi:(E)-4-hydroxy-3-methylbut-2-enyl-diphosphate synthase
MTKVIKIKNLKIGGGNNIAVQSMTNTSPLDAMATVKQIKDLEYAGCDIVRVAVPSQEAADKLPQIIKEIKIPLVADIHFDWRLAVSSIKNGANKIRINPGNIGSANNLKYITDCAKEYNVPIRVGANSGSLEKEFIGIGLTPSQQLVKSALKSVKLLEKTSFYDIVISVKSSSVKHMVEAYEQISKLTDYPLHLGVTEAGTYEMAMVKSAVGIGALLIKDIGDTIRVSVTGDPLLEIKAAQNILKACGKMPYPEIISCPTCGRCNYDIQSFITETEGVIKNIKKSLKIAIMGCVVNGPGEAKEADIGIAGGKDKMAIFSKGRIIKTVDSKNALEEFKKELNKLI